MVTRAQPPSSSGAHFPAFPGDLFSYSAAGMCWLRGRTAGSGGRVTSTARGAAGERTVLDVDFDADTLHLLRQYVTACWATAEMPHGRAAEFLIAMHELAANAVRHGPGTGRLLVSEVLGGLRCQVSDTGPGPRPWGLQQGHGLWIVNQVADQFSVSSGRDGFRVTAVFTRRAG
jgi:anti-sigma regulatory factor (Ser/Thr protein kinase)